MTQHTQTQAQPQSPTMSDFEHISHETTSLHSSMSTSGSSVSSNKARLVYCKSHISIHPTQFNRDNITGYLAIVEIGDTTTTAAATSDADGNVRHQTGKQLLITWVPDEVLQRMDEQDREGYRKVDKRKTGEEEEDGYVMVTVPPAKGEKYAFSVPLSNLYSILVYPPSLQHWYGSATINLTGGISLPTLFFHDDEKPLVAKTATQPPRSQWGFPPFLAILGSRATLLRSRLIAGKANHNAELWLVNPSKADREVHEASLSEEYSDVPSVRKGSSAPAYPPLAGFPDPKVLNNQPTPKQTLLTGLSNITSFSRRMSAQILAHPLAKEVVPHLPPAVRSLVNAPGEWERSGRLPPKSGKSDVASEFESARLYLARWARVVAEEGAKARREEVAGRAGIAKDGFSSVDDLTSSLGVFSLLSAPNSKRPTPHPTRSAEDPITPRDWDSFIAQGRDEFYVRREIFKRGFSDSTEEDAKRIRREGWEILLGIIPWSLGGVGGGTAGKEKRHSEREAKRSAKRAEYDRLKTAWRGDQGLKEAESWKEEWHRIDVDCRRTDRTQEIFAIPTEAIARGDAEKEAGGPSYDWEGMIEDEEGGSARLNPHIAALRTILMTYHTYLPELGYVQGMSDLLSPIYVVFGANEADAFWGLVGVMQIMESNFLRDQSGMKKQLSTLQQLIGVMDPELYAHLDRTGSMNLFFCFRWILISFKREFKFEDVIRLWEVLWTNVYSDHFVLFVALGVLQSHRDVLIRYLTEFDEVLKYANDLSGTIDLNTTLAQAEVLFLQFRGLIEDLDAENAEAAGPVDSGLRRRRSSTTSSLGEGVKVDAKDEKKQVSDDLRELLDGYKENHD